MNHNNSIGVTTVANLEAGDLIAYAFLETIVSGKISGIATYGFQLTDTQRAYMTKNNLEIPGYYGKLGLVAGEGSCLIFGDFRSDGVLLDHHMYMRFTALVAVFPDRIH